MQCLCGGEVVEQSHEVKTFDKAKEWFPGITENQLPVKVEKDICIGCRRFRRSIFSDGVLIYRKG